jgi:phosphoglycolate phosphatase
MSTILFDLDGTLTDPAEGITRCIAHALERMDVEAPPREQLLFAIGPPLRASLATLLGREDRESVERALGFYRERFAEVGLFENAPYAGIAEALARLRQDGTRLFVATSKPLVYAERIVRHFGFEPHFEAVHGCELDGTREDKRDLLGYLIPMRDVHAGQAVMVGDRGVDMIAARHHGLFALGAGWGYGSRDELNAAGANALCDSPHELNTALRALLPGDAPI